MNNKAFTLIELIAIILIIGMLILITIPIIGDVIEHSKEQAHDEQVNKIEQAALSYATENTGTLFPDGINSVEVNVETLQLEGYLPKTDIYSPLTVDIMDGCVTISLDSYNQFKGEYNEEC